MEFQIAQAIEVLERTPVAISGLLRGVSDVWLNAREGPDTFSAIDVLGHLIYGEQADWIPRARIILECGPAKTFEPFDRRGFGSIVDGQSGEALLSQFAELRRESLLALRGFDLDERRLDSAGTHPALGRVTLRQLIATWVAHDLGHIAQIVRVMARQYGEAVGPWREYLTIVK
ncbi:MAG TPA: DinB family protein [Candidatus Acidoferrales bacterium]|jgi:hypothetical protein|nr:DinB family protein [Candidatus Acidoferrales bacterium]